MALIVVRSFPNQQTLERRSYPTSNPGPKCPDRGSDHPPLATHSDLLVTTPSKLSPRSGQLSSLSVTRPPTNQHAILLLIQDLIPSFKSICWGLSLCGGVHYRHYSGGATSQGRGVMEPSSYASYLSIHNQLHHFQ